VTAAASAKEAAARSITGTEASLLELSRLIHANPELGFEEERSSGWCADFLDTHGYSVERGTCDLDTAFAATAGSGPLTIAICAEYDALPGIGHACGHNVIASAAMGAALALALLADDLGITVRILGTPAEEGGGGKILMLERGCHAVDLAQSEAKLSRQPCATSRPPAPLAPRCHGLTLRRMSGRWLPSES